MNVNLIPLKIKERLNKLDSNDYDHFHCWQYVEAFNKAQLEWVRRQLHGGNIYKEGDESTKRRIDDLQILLERQFLDKKDVTKEKIEFGTLPTDYMEYKRLDVKAKADCGIEKMNSKLVEEANVNEYLRDWTLRPSFEWRETFHTMRGNHFYVYTDTTFEIENVELTYYRKPLDISLTGCETITGEDNGDINPEFKDDIVELLIDEAVSILASDIESPNQIISSSNRVNKNN